MESLKNVKIGVKKGSAVIETLRNNYPSLVIVEVENIEKGLEKVTKDGLFGFVDSFATVAYLLQREYLGELQISAKFSEHFKLGIAVRDDDPVLLDIFNSIIQNLPFEIEEKILNKHIPINYIKGFDYALFGKVVSFFLVILFLFLYRYIVMKRYTHKIERYLKLVDSHVLISHSDKKGFITDVSEALCILSGYTKAELIGKPHNVFRHKDMESSIFENLWNTISKDKIWHGEVKNLNKDGTFYWADVKITTLYDNKGTKKRYSAIRENITDKKEIEKLSITDVLTQIPNRLYLDKNYQLESIRANRYDNEFSLILIDIDFFKKINDNYGHKIGDDVLIEIANILKENIRVIDILGRWGGEEFLIICPETNLYNAEKLAEKIRRKIENYMFIMAVHITGSFGVTQYYKGENKKEAFNRCDKGLYMAKKQGRNKVISIK